MALFALNAVADKKGRVLFPCLGFGSRGMAAEAQGRLLRLLRNTAQLGNRFRLLVNEVDAVAPPSPLPRLPVARALWACRPDFKTACAAWIQAGGAHHTGFSFSVTTEHLEDFASMTGIEIVVINTHTKVSELKKELRWNDIAYHLAQGLGRL